MYARGGFCFFSQFCPIKIKKFLTKFLYPIKDIGFLSSNMKRYFTSDYFLLSYGSLKIAKIACSGLIYARFDELLYNAETVTRIIYA